ncbi:S-adenosylmethionine:tRNA ribosyltransferase-isomerase [archaeon BMS3Bbin15]|nr:S-adenosylmethionine:tRNA ribosyltransferase-isomerase [archaeon BMS3Bbin15]
MLVDDFDYHLPENLIAQKPLEERDTSRLMVLDGRDIIHKHFRDLENYMNKGDVLVVNNSRVIPARLRGRKSTGGKIEVLLIRELATGWECLLRGRAGAGSELFFDGNLKARVLERHNEMAVLSFNAGSGLRSIIESIGEVPTPPYIKTKLEDSERYQTIYSKYEGSVAAPTAGFHFSEKLLKKLKNKGVEIAEITLHVGPGTFMPVKVKQIEKHKMHSEFFTIEAGEAEKINLALEEGKGVVAVGTTSVRALESATGEGRVIPKSSYTDIFIYPGYKFKLEYMGMITNFHLPKSTLLMLVCAFEGKERIFRAYEEAIKQRYRFYSFGDAMLLLR